MYVNNRLVDVDSLKKGKKNRLQILLPLGNRRVSRGCFNGSKVSKALIGYHGVA